MKCSVGTHPCGTLGLKRHVQPGVTHTHTHPRRKEAREGGEKKGGGEGSKRERTNTGEEKPRRDKQ
jgi:hypothetical protein